MVVPLLMPTDAVGCAWHLPRTGRGPMFLGWMDSGCWVARAVDHGNSGEIAELGGARTTNRNSDVPIYLFRWQRRSCSAGNRENWRTKSLDARAIGSRCLTQPMVRATFGFSENGKPTYFVLSIAAPVGNLGPGGCCHRSWVVSRGGSYHETRFTAVAGWHFVGDAAE